MRQLHSHHVEGDPDTCSSMSSTDANALTAHRESEHFKRYSVGVLSQKMRERNVETWLLSFEIPAQSN